MNGLDAGRGGAPWEAETPAPRTGQMYCVGSPETQCRSGSLQIYQQREVCQGSGGQRELKKGQVGGAFPAFPHPSRSAARGSQLRSPLSPLLVAQPCGCACLLTSPSTLSLAAVWLLIGRQRADDALPAFPALPDLLQPNWSGASAS